MTKLTPKKIFLIILIPILFSAVFAPLSSAHAMSGLELLNFTVDPAGAATQSINSSLIEFFGQFLAFMAQTLDWAVHIQNFEDVSIVKEVWTIVRNFVNMFFILILIVIAFGTIFNIDKYSARTPGVISRFIIAAILINFSLVIGILIINVSDSVSLMFLNSMGNDITGNIANGLGLQDIIAKDPSSFNASVAQNSSFGRMVTGIAMNGLFLLIMIVILFFTFSAAAIFALVRIPYLWGLLIVSPAIWALAIFPSTRSAWTKWWGQFMGWVLFLPTYLSIIFVVLAVLNSKQSIVASLGSAQAPSSFGSFIVENLFFYILVIMALIYGLKLSLSLGHVAGTSAGGAFKFIDNGIKNIAKRATRPYTEGAKQGLKATKDRFVENGILGIGSAKKARLRQAAVAQLFGARGEKERAQKQEVDKVHAQYKERGLTKEQLAQELNKTLLTSIEKIALRKIQAENGWIDAKDQSMVKNHLESLGGSATKQGREFISALQSGGFGDMFEDIEEKKKFIATITDMEFKKILLKSMADNKEFKEGDAGLIEETIKLFKNDSKEIRDKVFGSIQKNMSNVYKNLGDALTDSGAFNPATGGTPVSREAKKLIAKQIAEKNKVKTYGEYVAAMNILGNGTKEGIEFGEKVSEFNPTLAEEVKHRKSLGGSALDPTTTLSDTERSRLTDNLVTMLQKMDPEKVKNMSEDALSTPEMQTALHIFITRALTDPRDFAEFNKGLTRNKKQIISRAQANPSPSFTYHP